MMEEKKKKRPALFLRLFLDEKIMVEKHIQFYESMIGRKGKN